MTVILECEDRWRQAVVLHDRTWNDHVLSRRPYFAGHEQACVAAILAGPSFVRRDVDYPDRACFYGPSPLPSPHHDLLVKVVVAYAPAGPGVSQGTVVTVHLTSNLKTGEEPIWP